MYMYVYITQTCIICVCTIYVHFKAYRPCLDKFVDIIGGHACIRMCLLNRRVLYVFVHISYGVRAHVCTVKPVHVGGSLQEGN